MNPIFTGKINESGELILDAPQRFAEHKAALNCQKIELILRKQRSQRSEPLNRYYWGVVIPTLSKHTGYEPEEMHGILKFKFLRTIDDKGNERVKSTAKLDNAETIDYHDKIKRWASINLNCYIPDPNQYE